MRYGPEHKQATRERILRAARRLFRRHGYAGVGLDALMREAGLTRGAFYRHFRSKADLFAEAVAAEPDLVTRLRARDGAGAAGLARGARAVIADYLDPKNRAAVGRGCTMATLSADVARANARTRARFTDGVRALVAELERHLGDARSPDPRALAATALCVGGLTIARALDDEPLARAMLRACRDAADAQLGDA